MELISRSKLTAAVVIAAFEPCRAMTRAPHIAQNADKIRKATSLLKSIWFFMDNCLRLAGSISTLETKFFSSSWSCHQAGPLKRKLKTSALF